MRKLSVSALRRELGAAEAEEKIPMHGGAIRVREVWSRRGVSLLRDEEEEAVCLFIDPTTVHVVVAEEALPESEVAFLKCFPTAQKELGHSYTLLIESWRLTLDFEPSKKRRGVGSASRRLARVIVGKKEPNKAPEPTTMAVTIRAPSSTARASHGRGSS